MAETSVTKEASQETTLGKLELNKVVTVREKDEEENEEECVTPRDIGSMIPPPTVCPPAPPRKKQIIWDSKQTESSKTIFSQ